MTRLLAAVLLASLVACGGGAGGGGPYDPVTHARYVGSMDAGLLGLATWDDHGSGIEILLIRDRDAMRRILEHELWHLLTRNEDHPNDPPCVSTDGAYPAIEPCPEELAQVLEAGRVVRLSFPGDVMLAEEAALWWNTAAGRDLVIVED